MSKEPQCKYCRFWAETTSDIPGLQGDGECHRFPPTFATMPHGSPNFFWPVVERDQWCGEFSAGAFKAPG